ncbi:hypothetical protein OsJ_35991 [Oryza sativa Japonica Group]|uniref:Uncharacterized protein n=1 Tax=Oryza sativa subsp. japonica TaxID=39947 RepID=A3CH17_ORYSJ|nr:hypothetical protein OsJ_35991 [Oryza sativa Japonica Group]
MAGSVATGSGTAGDGVEEVSGGHRPAWGQHGGGQWRTAADGVEVSGGRRQMAWRRSTAADTGSRTASGSQTTAAARGLGDGSRRRQR